MRLRVDLTARTYSVWVRPPGASEVLLADQFPFRADAPAIDDLGQVALVSKRFESSLRLQNHTIRAESTTTLPGEIQPPLAPEPESLPEDTELAPDARSASSCASVPATPLVAAAALPWLVWSCVRRPSASPSSPPAAPTGRTAPR